MTTFEIIGHDLPPKTLMSATRRHDSISPAGKVCLGACRLGQKKRSRGAIRGSLDAKGVAAPVPSAADARAPLEWTIAPRPVDYPEALAAMERRVAAIRAGEAAEQIWLLEHPALYTAGTSAQEDDLLDAGRLPVYRTGRGGQYTYHGPGQRVAYVILDLAARRMDLRCFVRDLEQWLIETLTEFSVVGDKCPGRVGVWVTLEDGREAKIAALGIRVRRWAASTVSR